MMEREKKPMDGKWHLGLMLKSLEPKITASGDADVKSRYATLCEEYRYMLKYFADGVSDPQRIVMQHAMVKRAYALGNDVRALEMFRSNPAYSSLRQTVPVQEESAATLVESLRGKYVTQKEHHECLSRVFLSVFFSLSWREQDRRVWTAYLIDENVPAMDRQTIVSAVTLSCINSFCIEKFRTLAYTYLTSGDEHTRLRALVGCLLSLVDVSAVPFADEYRSMVADLFAEEGTERTVMELILLIIHCSEAEADNKKMQKEIIPDIMKSSRFSITPDGIKEKEEDPLDEILDLSKYDKEMERIESSIEKMRKLYDDGADVFYSGFSLMKRYPFFYKPYNWFVPFVKDHPDLASEIGGDDKMKFVEKLSDSGGLCDSDKYSLVFAFQSLLPTLPKEIRDAVVSGDGMTGVVGLASQEGDSMRGSYKCRMYLQNFYRFFKLNPQIRMTNLFEKRAWLASLLTLDCVSVESRRELCWFFLRRKYTAEAFLLTEGLEPNNVEMGLLLAAVEIERGRRKAAIDLYHKVLEMDSKCRVALYGVATQSFLSGDYLSASDAFTRLASIYPDNLSYQINRAMSGVMSGKAEELLNDVYRLDFEHDGQLEIKRLLAWTLLCLGRYEQSLSIYKKILRSDYGDATENDMLCLVDLYWAWGDVKSSVETMVRYRDQYLTGMSEENVCARLWEKMEDEGRHLSPYCPCFMDGIELLIDCVAFQRSLSSSDG